MAAQVRQGCDCGLSVWDSQLESVVHPRMAKPICQCRTGQRCQHNVTGLTGTIRAGFALYSNACMPTRITTCKCCYASGGNT